MLDRKVDVGQKGRCWTERSLFPIELYEVHRGIIFGCTDNFGSG